SCGPTDGPAWAFTITHAPPSCGPAPTGSALGITVWSSLDGAPPGAVYTIGSTIASQGQATYCPSGSGGPPCLTLTGTVTIESFRANTSAIFSYDLVDSFGSHYTWSRSAVDGWCPGGGLCG